MTALSSKTLTAVRQLKHGLLSRSGGAGGLYRHRDSQLTLVRWLNLQEYSSKQLMMDSGINVQKFHTVESVREANRVMERFDVKEYVVKAQVLAGGRGKGVFDSGFKGGVHLTTDKGKVAGLVEAMLGRCIVTKQTPPAGVKVRKVMIAEAMTIARETYFAVLMDRGHNGPVIVASPRGGIDIEEVAAQTPEFIFKEPIDILKGITDEQASRLARSLEFKGRLETVAAEQIKRLYKLFMKVDATQIEINPFGETADGRVMCFDAKMNFDDNAAFRQKDIFAMEDSSESDPREVEAAKYNLNYIGMDGNIGCLVNGAGLAMATMDLIKLHGGSPANFLDVGGGVTEGQIYHAFNILTNDTQVKAILVNVFGGIVNCATIANGIVNAAKSIQINVPIVVRLEGTNVTAAKLILEESGMAITAGIDLEDAAIKAVSSLKVTASS